MDVRARYQNGNIKATIKINKMVNDKPIAFKLSMLIGKELITKEFPSIQQAIGAASTYGCLIDKWITETI